MTQETQPENKIESRIFAISSPGKDPIYTDDAFMVDYARTRTDAVVTGLGVVPAERFERPAALDAAIGLFGQDVRAYIEQLEGCAWPLVGLNVADQVIEQQTIIYDGGPLSIKDSAIVACNWQFIGPAALTIQLLSLIDRTSPEMLQQMFPNLVATARLDGIRDFNKEMVAATEALGQEAQPSESATSDQPVTVKEQVSPSEVISTGFKTFDGPSGSGGYEADLYGAGSKDSVIDFGLN